MLLRPGLQLFVIVGQILMFEKEFLVQLRPGAVALLQKSES